MARKRRRVKIGRILYGIFIVLYMILLAAACGYGLTKVWDYAVEYERSRPLNTMDAYIESLGDNFWGDSMQATISGMEHEMQTDDECAAVVKEMLKDGVSYSQTGSENPDEMVYNIHCATGLLGKVTIQEDKSVESEFNLYPWVVTKEEFDFNGLYSSIQVTVPSNYSVQLNGHTLGSEYIIEDGIHMDVLEEYYESYSGLPTKCTYRFDKIIGILEPVILDANGNVTEIDKTKDDSQFIVSCGEDEQYALAQFAEAFCNEYFRYISGVSDINAGYAALQDYIIKGSDLDTHLLAAQDGLSWAHTNNLAINSFTLEDAIRLGDNAYLCYTSTDVTAYTTEEQDLTNNLKLIITGDMDSGDFKVVAVELY